MTPQHLFDTCRVLGVRLTPTYEGNLKFSAPAPVPDGLIAELRTHKAEVLAALRVAWLCRYCEQLLIIEAIEQAADLSLNTLWHCPSCLLSGITPEEIRKPPTCVTVGHVRCEVCPPDERSFPVESPASQEEIPENMKETERLPEELPVSLVREEGKNMNKTSIAWTKWTLNPIVGCSHISDGCQNCYAESQTIRLLARIYYPERSGPALPWTKANTQGNIRYRPEGTLPKLDGVQRRKDPGPVFLGSMSDLFHEVIAHVAALMPHWMFQGEKNPSVATNVLLATIASIEPRDSTESLLALQMAVTHHTALETLRRVFIPNQTFDGSQLYGHRANQLLRTFTAQLETLHRYRGSGQQKIRVEHVHVNAGGQAIVGTVQNQKGGRE